MDLHRIHDDLLLRPFFEDNFDVNSYIKATLRDSTNVDESVSTLKTRSHDVDNVIQHLVSSHQEDLLNVSSKSIQIKNSILAIQSRVQTLKNSSSRIKTGVLNPLQTLKQQVSLFENALNTTDALRLIQRFRSTTRRLYSIATKFTPDDTAAISATSSDQPIVNPSSSMLEDILSSIRKQNFDVKNIARVAPCIFELQSIIDHPASKHVNVLMNDAAIVQQITLSIRESARHSMIKSIEGLQVVDTIANINILFDLGILAPEIAELIIQYKFICKTLIQDTFNIKLIALASQQLIEGGSAVSVSAIISPSSYSLSGSKSNVKKDSNRAPPSALNPSAGAVAAWRGILYGRVESMCDTLSRLSLQFVNLLMAFATKLQSLSRESGSNNLCDTVISELFRHLQDNSSLKLVDILNPCGMLLGDFWSNICDSLHQEIQSVLKDDSKTFIKNSLIDSYARFHYSIADVIPKTFRSLILRGGSSDASGFEVNSKLPTLSSKTNHSYLFPSNAIDFFLSNCAFSKLLDSIQPLVVPFLSKSVSRLNEACNAMFPSSVIKTAHPGNGVTNADSFYLKTLSSALLPLHSPETERYMDEKYPMDTVSSVSIKNFVKLILNEIQACRATSYSSITTQLPNSISSNSSVPNSWLFSPQERSDPTLLLNICKSIVSSIKLFATKVESIIVTSPSATSFVEGCNVFPAQAFNFQIINGIDEIRKHLIKIISDLPIPPELQHTISLEMLSSSSSKRINDFIQSYSKEQVLSFPLDASLAAIVSSIESSPTIPNPQCVLFQAVRVLDKTLESAFLPWISGAALPMELMVLQMHSQLPSAKSIDGEIQQNVSPYVDSLSRFVSDISQNQIAILIQSTNLNELARAILSKRILSFFLRQVFLLRFNDQLKACLLKDSSGIQTITSSLFNADLSSLGRTYAEFKALKPFLSIPVADFAGAIASYSQGEPFSSDTRKSKIMAILRTMRRSNLYHHFLSKLPHEYCSMPYETGNSLQGVLQVYSYNEALDAAVLEANGANLTMIHRLWVKDQDASERKVVDSVMKCLETFESRYARASHGDGSTSESNSEIVKILRSNF
jgi:Golgi transport complex subunit 5